MKKLLTTAIAAALMISMSMTAFAAAGGETISPLNDKEIDVQAKCIDGTNTPYVYSVDVEWGAMQFTYTEGGTRQWNPETHEYSVIGSTSDWTSEGNNLKVTNHSNDEVNVNFYYASLAEFSTVTGAFTTTGKRLAAGVESEYNNADYVETNLNLSGTLDSARTEFTKVGNITVSLS